MIPKGLWCIIIWGWYEAYLFGVSNFNFHLWSLDFFLMCLIFGALTKDRLPNTDPEIAVSLISCEKDPVQWNKTYIPRSCKTALWFGVLNASWHCSGQ